VRTEEGKAYAAKMRRRAECTEKALMAAIRAMVRDAGKVDVIPAMCKAAIEASRRAECWTREMEE
jgi:hypothetical protein